MSFKLNRFSDARQDQVDQLIAYAELLGLSGRDLVSIGGKMDREKIKVKKVSNMEIIKGFDCLPIGRDEKTDFKLGTRFKLKTIDGAYNFECIDRWDTWEIVSLKTKGRRIHKIDFWEYELPKTGYQNKSRYSMLLDIALGKFPLNF